MGNPRHFLVNQLEVFPVVDRTVRFHDFLIIFFKRTIHNIPPQAICLFLYPLVVSKGVCFELQILLYNILGKKSSNIAKLT